MYSILGILKNKYVQSVLVFIVIVLGYGIYDGITNRNVNAPQESDSSNTATADITESPSTVSTEDDSQRAEGASEAMDYTGTHIMANGNVMTGKGVILPDATVLLDGTIELRDGSIIIPVFDFRK